MKRLLILCALATCAPGAAAEAAYVQWKGTFCIAATQGACSWGIGCYPMRYHPPKVGDNGPETNLSVFATGQGRALGGQASNYVLQSGNLIGNRFKSVDGSGIGRRSYEFPATMRIKTQTPAKPTETSTFLTIEGSIRGFDHSSTCNIDFIGQGIVESY